MSSIISQVRGKKHKLPPFNITCNLKIAAVTSFASAESDSEVASAAVVSSPIRTTEIRVRSKPMSNLNTHTRTQVISNESEMYHHMKHI